MSDRSTSEVASIAFMLDLGYRVKSGWRPYIGEKVKALIESERAEADRRVAEERAAVVRWLRGNECFFTPGGASAFAKKIERGEHRK